MSRASIKKIAFVLLMQIVMLSLFTGTVYAHSGGTGTGVAGAVIWCPEGQNPVPAANGCTQTYTSMAALLTFLKANEGNAAYQQAGTIFMGIGTYNGGDPQINLNTYGFTIFNNYNLRLQGAWDTTTDTVNHASFTSFQIPIIIATSSTPWGGVIIIQNIKIASPRLNIGIQAYSQQYVNLNYVQVTGVQNNDGASLGSVLGDVVITDSVFSNNRRGAYIKAGSGVIFDDQFTNFNSNSTDGVVIDAVGDVAMTNSTFNSNGGGGLTINNGGITSIVNNQDNGNNAYGANINSTGAIQITQSTFNGNTGESGSPCGNSTKTSPKPGKITNGCMGWNWSGGGGSSSGYGLEAFSKDYVKVDTINANGNNTFGAYLNAPHAVTISSSTFDQNGAASVNKYGIKQKTPNCGQCGKDGGNDGRGLIVVSTGDVSISDSEANNDPVFGADIAGGSVSVSTSLFNQLSCVNNGNKKNTNGCNNFYDNSGSYGLHIASQSGINLNTVTANKNDLYGGWLEAVSNVNVVNSTFDNTGDTDTGYASKGANNGIGKDCGNNGHGIGLLATSGGFATLLNVQANQNGLSGTDITAAQDVYIINSTFTQNGTNGAVVSSHGMVSVDTSTFDQNGYRQTGYGLRINGATAVALSNVTATRNGTDGVFVNVKGITVTVTGGVFSNNGSYGIDAHGSVISLSGAPVFSSNGRGRYLS